jgi:hypothetical protein
LISSDTATNTWPPTCVTSLHCRTRPTHAISLPPHGQPTSQQCQPPHHSPHLHHCQVLAWRHSLLVEAQPLLHLVAQLLTKRARRAVQEAVDAACDAALVGQVARDAALVALLGAADEAAVEDEAVLGSVALGLQRPAGSSSSNDAVSGENCADVRVGYVSSLAQEWQQHISNCVRTTVYADAR